MEADEKWPPGSDADEKWPPEEETERKWPPDPEAFLKFLVGVLVFVVVIAWYQMHARREYIAGENGAVIEIDRWNRTATECWPNGVFTEKFRPVSKDVKICVTGYGTVVN